jgi:hypothetical protein
LFRLSLEPLDSFFLCADCCLQTALSFSLAPARDIIIADASALSPGVTRFCGLGQSESCFMLPYLLTV